MNILLIATRDPRGPATGRKIVLRTIIRSLSALNHNVKIVAFGNRESAACTDPALGAEITIIKVPNSMRIAWNVLRHNLPGRLSLNECLYYSPRIAGRIHRLAAQFAADFVIADMIRTAEYAAGTGLPWFVDLDDLLSTRYEGWLKHAHDAPSILGYYGKVPRGLPQHAFAAVAARLLRWEANVLKQRELDVARRAGGVSMVSEVEARTLMNLCGRKVFCLPMAIGVAEHVAPELTRRPMRMAFSGYLDYRPNAESLSFYANSVVPVLRENGMTHLQLNVFGHCPTAVQKRVESELVRFHGYVEDLHRSLLAHQLFLAPLQTGTGVKTKIVEAMMLGLPVVTTPVGTQGLDVRHGEHCYVWRTADELVAVLREIEAAPRKAAEVAKHGMDYARSHFSPAVLQRSWEDALRMSMAG